LGKKLPLFAFLIRVLHFYFLGGILAIKILTATKEFLDILFIFEFLTGGAL
jgi:hypothetical protein